MSRNQNSSGKQVKTLDYDLIAPEKAQSHRLTWLAEMRGRNPATPCNSKRSLPIPSNAEFEDNVFISD
jgi:hypothetical protein